MSAITMIALLMIAPWFILAIAAIVAVIFNAGE